MVVRYLLASKHPEPYVFGAQVFVPTSLVIDNWRNLLSFYHDKIVAEFLTFGWPINYAAASTPVLTRHNLVSATQYGSHVRQHIDAELKWHAIAGTFDQNPLSAALICFPLQTVPKRGSTTCYIVMDLSFPPGHSVNDSVSTDSFLGEQYKLRLPGIDRLVKFIFLKGRNCLIFRNDLHHRFSTSCSFISVDYG